MSKNWVPKRLLTPHAAVIARMNQPPWTIAPHLRSSEDFIFEGSGPHDFPFSLCPHCGKEAAWLLPPGGPGTPRPPSEVAYSHATDREERLEVYAVHRDYYSERDDDWVREHPAGETTLCFASLDDFEESEPRRCFVFKKADPDDPAKTHVWEVCDPYFAYVGWEDRSGHLHGKRQLWALWTPGNSTSLVHRLAGAFGVNLASRKLWLSLALLVLACVGMFATYMTWLSPEARLGRLHSVLLRVADGHTEILEEPARHRLFRHELRSACGEDRGRIKAFRDSAVAFGCLPLVYFRDVLASIGKGELVRSAERTRYERYYTPPDGAGFDDDEILSILRGDPVPVDRETWGTSQMVVTNEWLESSVGRATQRCSDVRALMSGLP